MSAIASQITSLTIVYSRRRSKKTSKLRVTGICEGNSPVIGEFPVQRACNTENVSIWSRNSVCEWTRVGVDQDSGVEKVENTMILISLNLKFWMHDDVIKWKHFPRYWPFVWVIHRFPVNSSNKGQWRGALMFSLICTRINGWVNNREAGDLRRHRSHYDVTVMIHLYLVGWELECKRSRGMRQSRIISWERLDLSGKCT